MDSERLKAVRRPALVALAASLGTLALHYRDPNRSGSWGYCPSALLGFSCPGCGALRAVHDISNFDFASAASNNILLLILAPFAVAFMAWWLASSWKNSRDSFPRLPKEFWFGLLAVAILFALARNMPFGEYLQPDGDSKTVPSLRSLL